MRIKSVLIQYKNFLFEHEKNYIEHREKTVIFDERAGRFLFLRLIMTQKRHIISLQKKL